MTVRANRENGECETLMGCNVKAAYANQTSSMSARPVAATHWHNPQLISSMPDLEHVPTSGGLAIVAQI